jgi:uncharacterized iron-regulated membrane protein
MVSGKLRSIFRRIHLIVALVFGGIFALSGITGSAIAWMHELDGLLNPDLFHVTSVLRDGDRPARISPETVQRIVNRLSADPAYGRPSMLMLPEQADETVVAWYRKAPGAGGAKSPFALDASRQVMIDPYTLAVAGERVWGDIGISRRLLMPTVFHLHRYLLTGEVGKTVIGISGLAMLIMTSAGLVLWWPKGTLEGWRKALAISYRGSWPRLNYSFHRAAGFFVAPVLAVLGFSGWSFNLPQWVTPLVASVATVSPQDKLANEAANGRAHIQAAQAMETAQKLFPSGRVSRIVFPAKQSTPYEIRVRQPDEVRKGDGNTRITIDAYAGTVLRVRDPIRATGGDNFLNWQFPLHSGEAFGTGGRIFVACIGIAPLLFLITGVALWLRRKTAHSPREERG